MDRGLPDGKSADCKATELWVTRCYLPPAHHLHVEPIAYNSELRHLQKFSNDTAIVGFVEGGLEEYRGLVDRFDKWCWEDRLQLNVIKMKEILVDFRKNKVLPPPVYISGSDMEIVTSIQEPGRPTERQTGLVHRTCGHL